MCKCMKSYLYKGNSEIITNSSSGGAFKRLVSCIASGKETIVYGAIWSENLTVSHTYSVYGDDLQCFSESKYARSEMGDSFKNVASNLLEGKRVIFSGTPCQVAGLRQFLTIKKINMNNLYLIDVICHGTPSPMVLNDWIKSTEKKYGRKIVSVSFRDKSIGWLGYPTKVILDNGKVIRHTYKTQEFMRLFFTHTVLGPSCYECPFSNLERKSDVTIGDFWGIENSYPNIDPGKGVSLILANTEKGMKCLESIFKDKKEDELIIECDTGSYLQYQYNLRKPTERPVIREEFWTIYKKYGYDYTMKKYKINSKLRNIKFNIKCILSKMKVYGKVF